MKTWRYFEFDQCPECGNDLEVLSDGEDGEVYDGDDIRCVDCGFVSGVSVDEDGEAWVQDV